MQKKNRRECYFPPISWVLIFHRYICHYIPPACSGCSLPYLDVHFISLLFNCPLTSLYLPLSVPSALISIPIAPLQPTFSPSFSWQRDTTALNRNWLRANIKKKKERKKRGNSEMSFNNPQRIADGRGDEVWFVKKSVGKAKSLLFFPKGTRIK